MKSIFYSLALFIMTGILFAGCEEIQEELLKDLTAGKMVVVFDGGEKEVFDCDFVQMGEGGSADFTGEVSIYGTKPLTSTDESYVSIMYGSWTNEIPLTAKSYSTSKEEDLISINTSYGETGEGANITVVYTTVTKTAIKGTFTGKLHTQDGVKNISGAFWAAETEQPEY